MHAHISLLPIAVRVYSQPHDTKPYVPSRRAWVQPDAMLVFDTETRIDAPQALTFGSYRFIDQGDCLEEGLIVADDLPARDRAVLTRYVATHRADVAEDGIRDLQLLTRRAFVDKLFEVAYRARGLVVGFNLPFDLSRIGVDVTAARKVYTGGFSLGLWAYADPSGTERTDRFRPRLAVKHIDSKRALMGFTARSRPDPTDRIPDGSTTGAPQKRYVFPGYFLDLRTLAFALTDRGHSLETACTAFGVAHGKQKVSKHGTVSPAYIDYNRRDVLATWELAVKLLEEYDTHPIALQATKAYSPASIGKAYLRAMGIRPVLERQLDFPKTRLGQATSAFSGGRAGAHIRKVPVPIVSVDFLSMYTTVNSLMGLWRYVIAKRLTVSRCRTKVQDFLNRLTPDDLFVPSTWAHLTAFVRLVPNGDVLPTRSQYGPSHDWQIGINHLHAAGTSAKHTLWYALPDVVASVLVTGQVPTILDAFEITADGISDDLTPTALRGVIPIDPRRQDFFTTIIEERKRLSTRTDLTPEDCERLDKALKVLASATSYGIYAEMHQQESEEPVSVRCYGIDATPFTCRVAHPEVPGEYCFPPFASLITSAARLMLMLLEHAVRERGGTHAMEDTDSMAIVATKKGGLVPCPGGPHRLKDGREAVRALSWAQVEQIRERFSTLNPYDRSAVPGSILKIEGENFDPETKHRRQLYCLAISAKRYALFVRNAKGTPSLVKHSEHGLGHLLNPTDPDSDDRNWIAQVWLNMVRRALDLPTRPLPFEHRPAVGRITISSPAVLRPLARLNDGKPYADQLKPFNFLLTCHVKAFGHPSGADPERFHLIAPYEPDPARWTQMEWTDQYTGSKYRITTDGPHGTRRKARVKTYRDVLQEYEWHPESKCADAEGCRCEKPTIGLLQRRHVRVAALKYIGKESNHLDEVDSGLIHAAESVYTEYPDPRCDEWHVLQEALKRIPLKVWEEKTGKSRRMLIDARTGRRRPHAKNRELLAAIVRGLGVL